MITKTVEIRDRATFIPALAIKLTPETDGDRYLLGRAGFGRSPEKQAAYVLLARIAGGEGHFDCDAETWGSRTMTSAHRWLIEHFDEIESGAVVDVEFIEGERAAPKRSEAFE
jgi:hypothetical protein